jgi:hypothetical protein
METKSLLETTVLLLRERGRYREVADATGLGYEWLAKLVQGRIHDPGVNKIELLNRFLVEEAELKTELRERYGAESRGVA